MADKKPLKKIYTGSPAQATGLGEFATADTIGFVDGGTGLAALGSAGQVLKVNSGASALEYGNVEAVLNIDGMTDGSGITIAATDKFAASDGGTEKYVVASQLTTFIKANTGLTASRLLVSDGSGNLVVSAVTATEAGYLDGVTSAIQTQLDAKAAKAFAIAQAIALG